MREWSRFCKSMGHALDGICYTIKTQRNMQIHLIAALLVCGLGWVFALPWRDVLLVFFSIFFVFVTETINTAIEAVVNLVTKEYQPLAKIAKDVAAGAVLLAALLAIIVGVSVFAEPCIRWVRLHLYT